MQRSLQLVRPRHVGRHLIASSQKFGQLKVGVHTYEGTYSDSQGLRAPPGPEVLTLGLALARGAIGPLRPA